jgi:hypothetical protein
VSALARSTPRAIAAAALLQVVVLAFLVLALLDRRAHRQDPAYGINQWGYRDEARAAKEPGEIRVALVGGSSAFERGMVASSTVAGKLLIELRAAGAPVGRLFSVSNLSEPAVGADSYIDTLRGYAYLRPDAIVVFDGYDALAGLPPHARRQSIVYRTLGYLPLLPARTLARPEWMSDADGGIADLLRSDDQTNDVSCAGRSNAYCSAMAATVAFALEQGYPVLVASPPTVSAAHRRQQQSLGTLLTERFARQPRFKSIDLGSSIDLHDPANSPDGIHRTDLGNHVVSQKIATALLGWEAFAGRTR